MDYAKPSPTYAKSVDRFMAQVAAPRPVLPTTATRCERAQSLGARGARAAAGGIRRDDRAAACLVHAPDARRKQTGAHGREALAFNSATRFRALTAREHARALAFERLGLPGASASRLTASEPSPLADARAVGRSSEASELGLRSGIARDRKEE